MKKLLLYLMRLFPLRKFIIFESHPDFSDNSFALYQELLRRNVNAEYRIYWMKTFRADEVPELPWQVDTFEAKPATFRESLKRAYILNCSRFIIDCNTFVHKRRKGQVRIHLGHGMPIKIDLEYSRKFGDCDKYMIQSGFWREIYQNQIHVPGEVLCELGYPRNDVLVNPVKNLTWEETVRKDAKVIVWMPTYRQHRLHMERAMHNKYPYGLPCVHNEAELRQLHDCLEQDNILVLFRPHPVQELSVFSEQELPHIQIADDAYLNEWGLTLYELLGNSNGLITDYSSVYFDYLLTDCPIALTIEDRQEYFKHYTLAFSDYKKFIKGFYIEEFTELLRFVKETASGVDSAREARQHAKKMFHTDARGDSAQKIVDMLVREYGL